MSLQVIGAGFGRTGTKSLKEALETLGFDPCYHMFEVVLHPEHVSHWQTAVDNQPVDWHAIFSEYKAAVDWPTAAFWPELSQHYPDAKIILSKRDSESWYRSITQTIFPTVTRPASESQRVGPEHRRMTRSLIIDRVFGGRHEDKAHVINVYEENTQRVLDELPEERRLIFDAADGWAPLCKFLDVPVPSAPYPNTNSTAEFKERANLKSE